MQTRTLPKITRRKLSKAKISFFSFFFSLPVPQSKFKIYFLRRSHTFLERHTFDGEEEERREHSGDLLATTDLGR